MLLREKERDKNLRKKDKEKFEQMLKMRHEIDIESENLSHSERTLNSRYEVELLKMKNQLQLAEGERQAMSRKEGEKGERQRELEETVSELRMAVEMGKEERRDKDRQIGELEDRCEKLLADYCSLAAKLSESERISQEREDRNEQLQSQHNELILKNSQNSHKKQEITHQLEQRNRRVDQLEKENAKLQREIASLKLQAEENDRTAAQWQ